MKRSFLVPGKRAALICDQELQGDIILATKLHIPLPRSNLVSRPYLLERLNRGLDCRLIFVSGPPGFGKTTLLSEWLRQKDGSGSPRETEGNPIKAAWLSLDAGDNDPVRFLRYVIAALRTTAPQVGETILPLLQAPQPPRVQSILMGLVNELCTASDTLILVLDDYHTIDATVIHNAVTFLLDNLPPCLHLVIATRADPPLPLARWRSRGQLAEIRTDDLRFMPDESTTFLNQVMQLNLSAENIATLVSRTEGWIVGLQMAAVSLQGRTDTEAFIQAFSGSHHFVVDYLVEEVLSRQSEDVQTFLLQTSILERLTGPLCDALMNRPGSQAMLEKLEEANLFLSPLDDERCWYRYHHLFRDLLRKQLQQKHPDLVPELHRRVSLWFELHGLAESAIEHALLARDQQRAVHLVNDGAEEIFGRGEHTTLLHWIAVLPEAEQKAHPLIGAFQAIVLSYAGKTREAEQLLREVDQALLNVDNHTVRDRCLLGRVATAHALVASLRDDPQVIIDYAQQALAYLSSGDLGWRSSVLLAASHAYRIAGDLSAAVEALSEAIALGRSLDNPMLVLAAIPHLAEVYRMQGRLSQAAQICQTGLRHIEQHSLTHAPMSDALFIVWGYILYERGELELAAENIQRGVALSQSGHRIVNQVWACQCLIRLSISRDDWPAAEEWVRQAETLIQDYALPFRAYPSMISFKVRILIKYDRLAEAGKVLLGYHIQPGDRLSLSHFPLYLSLARLLLAQGHLSAAEGMLDRLLEFAQSNGHWRCALTAHILRCLLYLTWHNVERALDALAAAMELAEPDGFIQDFLDEGEPMKHLLHEAVHRHIRPAFAHKLLAAFPQEPAATPLAPSAGEWVEALSKRELEVLRLMATGLSNQEIAEQLVLAIGTVKAHVHNIYGKLGAQHRTQALARAKELNLL
jgi:LuxR family maltose regulon positive regulatory protein